MTDISPHRAASPDSFGVGLKGLTPLDSWMVRRARNGHLTGRTPLIQQWIDRYGLQAAGYLACVPLWGSLAGVFGILGVLILFASSTLWLLGVLLLVVFGVSIAMTFVRLVQVAVTRSGA
jgi:hypothetical protein